MKPANGVVYLCTAALLTSIAGCAGHSGTGSKSGGDEFVLALPADPQNLDPNGPFGRIRSNLQMTRLLYDPLVNIGADGKAVPGLAERWTATGSKISFQLRDDVTCAHGERLTASDVAANFKYVLDIKNASSARGTAVPPDVKVSSDDASTVTLTTSTPPTFLLSQLSTFGIVCPAGLKDRKSLVHGSDGTGPYTVTKATMGSEYRLTRRTGYAWGPPGDPAGSPPKSIVVRIIENETTATNLLLSGEVNAVAVRGTDQTRLGRSGLASHTFREPIGQLWFNQRKGHVTVDDKLRAALIRAVDIGQVSKVASQGKGVPSEGMLQEPLVCGAVPPASALPRLDRAAAESMLTAAGWTRGAGGWTKDGHPLNLTLIYLTSLGPTVKSGAELLARTWTDFGVHATAKPLTDALFGTTLMSTGDWDVVWAVNYTLVPTHLMGYVSGDEPPDGKDFAGIHNGRYERLAKAGAAGTDCTAWNAAETDLFTSTSIVPFDDIKVPVFAKGATFALGAGGQVLPTTIRMR